MGLSVPEVAARVKEALGGISARLSRASSAVFATQPEGWSQTLKAHRLPPRFSRGASSESTDGRGPRRSPALSSGHSIPYGEQRGGDIVVREREQGPDTALLRSD